MQVTYVVRTRKGRQYLAALGVPGLLTRDKAKAFVFWKRHAAFEAAYYLRVCMGLQAARVFRRTPKLSPGHERLGA